MVEFTDSEIIALLDKLIGCTEPQGDSSIDRDVKENLILLLDVMDWYMNVVVHVAKQRACYLHSVNDIAETAYKKLVDWRKMLEELE